MGFKVKKLDIITDVEVGDILENWFTGEKIIVTYIAESKTYIGGKLFMTPKKDIFDTGDRQWDKFNTLKNGKPLKGAKWHKGLDLTKSYQE